MADPTLRLTYTQLRIRVAEYLGVAYYGAGGGEAAQLPTDAHDLDLVGRLVNDGYARFITDHEKGWKFLTVPMSLTFGTGTVDSDDARYYLPDDFYGILVQPFTYTATAPLIRIEPVSESRLRELQASSEATGTPSVVAVRAINTDATDTAQRWEAIFWPTPTGTETVTALYKRFPQALTNAGDVSVAGFQHDRTVLDAALAAAELQRDDRVGPREAAYQQSLVRSRKIDDRVGSPRVADYGDRSEDRIVARRRYSVDSYNGVSLD